MANINPEEFVFQLSENVSTRKRRSIELLHNICKEQHMRGSKDFSIPTIVSLSNAIGGPSEQTIRNKSGSDYRAVLSCWAQYTNGFNKKIKVERQTSTGDEILNGITDPTIRALVGIILAENRKLKSENSLLKQKTSITIDMRSSTQQPLSIEDTGLVPQATKLFQSEITSLQYAISDEFLKHQGWVADAQGQVKEKGMQIYKPGYLTAIKKILFNYS